jgi:hypothetical protein
VTLHVPSFAGGVVRTGSPDAQATDELLEADSLDIGPRGQLVCATDVSDYVTLNDLFGRVFRDVYGIADVVVGGVPQLLVLGRGRDITNVFERYAIARFARSGAVSPVAGGAYFVAVPPAAGVQMTSVQFPGLFTVGGVPSSLVLACLGAREGTYPRAALGLSVYAYDPATTNVTIYGTSQLDCLGTGPSGATFPGGTQAKPLYPRGIVGYNNHVFAYGFDDADAVNGDGPSRVMFSNEGDPRKWGNDNTGAGDRLFTDSDAIVLGDAGELIRGALKWNGRLFFGTNQQLHYIAGFGRDSYRTDGANPVAKSYNIVGPNALIEGPDKLLYQVSDQGLVAHDGASFEPHFKRLVDFHGHSSGWWDLIWTDPAAAVGYPGRTNQDLVWTAVDWDREQVLIGIPFCNAAAGAGAGVDTVVIKFHTRSGGFTRQVFSGVAYSAAGYFRREGQQREVRLLGTASAGKATIQYYGYQAVPTSSPVMPTRLPRTTFGPYAPFGPDGQGVLRRCYLTIAWESTASLPIVFTVSTTLDGAATDSYTLTIGPVAPGAPVAGDVWLDTSETDTSLGNATAGALVAAAGGYLAKTWSGTIWRAIPGSGEKGMRATIPLPLTRRAAARVTVTVVCTSAVGRFQIEGLGINPGGGTSHA